MGWHIARVKVSTRARNAGAGFGGGGWGGVRKGWSDRRPGLAGAGPTPHTKGVHMFAKFINRFLDLIACRVAGLLPIDAVCKQIATHINVCHLAEVVCDTLDMSEIEQNIAKTVTISATDVAGEIDTNDIVNGLDQEEIADKVAGYIELDYDKVCAALDLDYSEIGANIDLGDLSREIDTSDMKFDYSEIASNVSLSDLAEEFHAVEIAEAINYEELAKALLSQFAKAKAVEVRPAGK